MMNRMKPLQRVQAIENMEIALTMLNAERSVVPFKRQLTVWTEGGCALLRDSASPTSFYYNRIKGFGPQDLPNLDRLLGYYPESAPCVDMIPGKLTEEVGQALAARGYVPAEQLAFLAVELPEGVHMAEHSHAAYAIERVTADTAAEFIGWIAASNGGLDISAETVERVKGFYHRPDFINYMLRIGGYPAAMGSLFLHGGAAYLANDYTFDSFRGRGCQTALIRRRLADAVRLGALAVYTDVEFGTVSHANMEKAGFRTAYLSTFWLKRHR
jgi:hypothetical protein